MFSVGASALMRRTIIANYICPLGYSTWQDAAEVGEQVALDSGYLLTRERAEKIEAASTTLSFYPQDLRLLRVRRREWPAKYAVYYIAPEASGFVRGARVRLNSTSLPVHELNRKVKLELRQDQVAAYLRFFCFFVHGVGGPFALVERADDPVVPLDAPDDMRRVFDQAARPVIIEGSDQRGWTLASAIVWFGFGLFLAQFAVAPNGLVEMLDDDPIAANLPLDPQWRID